MNIHEYARYKTGIIHEYSRIFMNYSWSRKQGMPKYILGAGGQLYYFQGFREHQQDNCREQRKIFSGSKGSPIWASSVARL